MKENKLDTPNKLKNMIHFSLQEDFRVLNDDSLQFPLSENGLLEELVNIWKAKNNISRPHMNEPQGNEDEWNEYFLNYKCGNSSIIVCSFRTFPEISSFEESEMEIPIRQEDQKAVQIIVDQNCMACYGLPADFLIPQEC